jgi:hypothetical protein
VNRNLNDPNPKAFDCSELVQWAAHQVGVSIPDGTMNQLPHIQRAGKTISVDQALRTKGALLLRPGHVAISLGDGAPSRPRAPSTVWASSAPTAAGGRRVASSLACGTELASRSSTRAGAEQLAGLVR